MIIKYLIDKGCSFLTRLYYIIQGMSYIIHTFGAKGKGQRARGREQRAGSKGQGD
jgi:hypothetical protein